jgi:hypothetical protein
VAGPPCRKIEYVDELLNDIAGTRPKNRVRKKIEKLPDIRITLREHYDRKRAKYAFEWPAYLDNDLRRIFSNEPRHRTRETAVSFLRRTGAEIQQLVSDGTGVHGYAIDHLLELMTERAAQLKLRAVGTRRATQTTINGDADSSDDERRALGLLPDCFVIRSVFLAWREERR